jgi:DNA-binding XRE family transcriptional regulator
VDKIADHHSAGILSRCHHFETVEGFAPVALAMASFEAHASTTLRKVRNSFIDGCLGQSVLNCKANLSLDADLSLGHTVHMSEHDQEALYKQEFMRRIAEARIARGWKQWQAAEALGMSQDKYKQYETRSLLPHYLIPRFCLVMRIDPEWLVTGKGQKPIQALRAVENDQPKPATKPRRNKARSVA